MGPGLYRGIIGEMPYAAHLGMGGSRPEPKLIYSPVTGETYIIEYYHDGTVVGFDVATVEDKTSFDYV